MIGTLAERFWAKVDKRGQDECWEWQGVKNQGYGRIKSGGRDSRMLGAHRVSWELANGPIPKGKGYHGTCVLHLCDNRSCVNPAHLFLGTQGDNVHDMIDKGRDPDRRGEINGRAKLIKQDVYEIRAMLSRDMLERVIAKKYGVSQHAISLIKTGKNWGWLREKANVA